MKRYCYVLEAAYHHTPDGGGTWQTCRHRVLRAAGTRVHVEASCGDDDRPLDLNAAPILLDPYVLRAGGFEHCGGFAFTLSAKPETIGAETGALDFRHALAGAIGALDRAINFPITFTEDERSHVIEQLDEIAVCMEGLGFLLPGKFYRAQQRRKNARARARDLGRRAA